MLSFKSITKAFVEWFAKLQAERGETSGARSIKELGQRRIQYLSLVVLYMWQKTYGDSQIKLDDADFDKLHAPKDELTSNYMFYYDATQKRADEYFVAMTAPFGPLLCNKTNHVKLKPEWQEEVKKWFTKAQEELDKKA